MRLAALTLAVTLGALTAFSVPARADGFFYGQSYGISSARKDGSSMLGGSLQLRVAFGWRSGPLSFGPWVGGNLAIEREGALFGLVGGDPPPGDSDLKNYGLDARYNAEIGHHLSLYVRGGPRFANGSGALAGYRGFGVGAATGLQLTGRVRALGFLFAPLFFYKRGPYVNATVFIDQNVDFYQLDAPGMSTLSVPLIGTSIGIGVGSYL